MDADKLHEKYPFSLNLPPEDNERVPSENKPDVVYKPVCRCPKKWENYQFRDDSVYSPQYFCYDHRRSVDDIKADFASVNCVKAKASFHSDDLFDEAIQGIDIDELNDVLNSTSFLHQDDDACVELNTNANTSVHSEDLFDDEDMVMTESVDANSDDDCLELVKDLGDLSCFNKTDVFNEIDTSKIGNEGKVDLSENKTGLQNVLDTKAACEGNSSDRLMECDVNTLQTNAASIENSRIRDNLPNAAVINTQQNVHLSDVPQTSEKSLPDDSVKLNEEKDSKCVQQVSIPKSLPFYTVNGIYKNIDGIRSIFRVCGMCKLINDDWYLVSPEKRGECSVILLDFENALRVDELDTNASNPVQIYGCLNLRRKGTREKILVSACYVYKTLYDFQKGVEFHGRMEKFVPFCK